eukprot:TRINITY_DN17061_c0_g1_i1.p1 TRINITY_DN17061_c0_g1~~TRINITY_DN17061_c0_g1_i1.p1  ORF type:complete len:740 (+),score=141.86 TRINITY_DN17061_c0_g1_i1:43-2220(+)
MGKKKAPKAAATKPTKDAKKEKEDTTDTGAVANYAPPNYDENERNIKIQRLDINYHGHHVLKETKLELLQGRRYGLIGPNGCGKSTLMNVLGAGELALPPKLDYFHLSHEVEATEETVLECVMKVDTECARIEQEIEELQEKDDETEAAERLTELYTRLDELEAETAESRASRILFGLGFDATMQARPCSSYSGGWRMRVALAQVLFLRPSLMLLDEPTNHLDIEAVVWLENYLKYFKGILLMVSHSQDFMNSICTNIIHMRNGRLNYYTGNYDQYCITRDEKDEHQAKRRAWEQGQMKSMKDYIARFGHGSKKLARQAQSKEKTLEKMVRGGLTEAISRDTKVNFVFPEPGYLPPPVIKFENVHFKYPKMDKDLYENVEFGIDLDSHVCLVGPNGAGKTTLQKLITGELEPTKGYVSKNGHCVVARFNQHFVDQLDMSLTPLQYMRQEYPEVKEPEVMRSWIGRFGITGSFQTSPIATLSDGMKSRVVLAWMAQRAPHVLLLDEPTNHLDMDSIDALAEALNEFEGAVILVSHDMRLIAQAASEIWICDNNHVDKFEGDIADYKTLIEKRVEEAENKYKQSKQSPKEREKKDRVAKPAAKKKANKPAPKGPGKVVSLSAVKPATLKPPTSGSRLKVTVKKESGKGIGVGLDAYPLEDGELVLVLDNVAPGSVGDKHGLTPLVGCRIANFDGNAITSQEHAAQLAASLKEACSFELTFTELPDED